MTLVDLAEIQRRVKVALPGAAVEAHFVELRTDRVRVEVQWNNVTVERVYHIT